jgi:hypothetical protein
VHEPPGQSWRREGGQNHRADPGGAKGVIQKTCVQNPGQIYAARCNRQYSARHPKNPCRFARRLSLGEAPCPCHNRLVPRAGSRCGSRHLHKAPTRSSPHWTLAAQGPLVAPGCGGGALAVERPVPLPGGAARWRLPRFPGAGEGAHKGGGGEALT